MVSHERCIQRIRELASITSPDPEVLLSEGGALFAQLKALNRAATAATREHKQRTLEARHAMDQTYLELQNLMYQKRHFEKEIEKCRQFASIYQDVPLHSQEEFLALAPPEARTGSVLQDEHQLMLNKLSFELAERQRLLEVKRQVTTVRDSLLKETREQQAKLDVINSQVEGLSNAGVEAQLKVSELVPPEGKPEESHVDHFMDVIAQSQPATLSPTVNNT